MNGEAAEKMIQHSLGEAKKHFTEAERCANGGSDEKGYRRNLTLGLESGMQAIQGLFYQQQGIKNYLALPFWKRFETKEWVGIIIVLSQLQTQHESIHLTTLLKLLFGIV